MRAVPWTDFEKTAYPGFKSIVVGAPDGSLTGDGSTAEKAFAIDTLRGEESNGWPVFVEKWVPDGDDLDFLAKRDYFLEVRLYVPQLIVHSLTVQKIVQNGIPLT